MTAEEIVRALAEASPLAFDNQEERTCGLCWVDELTADGPWRELADPATHKPDCPWRLAREWVAAN